MKKLLWILIVFISVSFGASANTYDEAEEVLKELSGYTEGFDFYGFSQSILSDGNVLSKDSVAEGISDLFIKELKTSFKSLVMLLIPVFLFGILKFVTPSGDEGGVSSAAFIGCFALMCTVVIGVIKDMSNLVFDTAATVDIVTKGLVPTLFSFLAAMGNITQVTLAQPFVLSAAQLMSELLKEYILPFILLGFALSLSESITGMAGLKYFGELILKITKWILVFLVVVFLSLLSAQSIAGSGADSIAIKTTKFAVSNFIPVVGGAISDGVETLGMSVKTIKNAAGISGVAGIIYICFIPLVKIYGASLVFHILAALSYPVSDKRFGDILSGAGSVISLMGGVILAMAFIFIVTAAVVIGTNPAIGG